MENKLIIDLSSGRLEVSGTEQLIRDIYNDFKALQATFSAHPSAIKNIAVEEPTAPKAQTPEQAKKNGGSARQRTRKSVSSQPVNTELDTSGIEEYFAQFDLRKDADRALVFAKFLVDQKKMSTVSAIDIYTCFFALREELKLPNIESLLINDKARTKFFTRQGDGTVNITTIGENHFNRKLKKKEK